MPTSGERLPSRGEIWWVRLDKRRPAVIVQSDKLLDPRVRTFLVVPLTSRLHLESLPGTIRFDRRSTGLPKASIANVYDRQKVLRSDLLEPTGRLSQPQLTGLNEGLRLVLGL